MALDDIKLTQGGAQTAGTSVPQSSALPGGLENIDDNDPFADVKREMRTRFALLPEDIKAVILSSEYEMKLFNLAKTHKLTYEELGTLELETTMMLLGMTPAAEFRDELQIELKKNDAEVDALINDLNKEVFTNIRQSIERVGQGQKAPELYMEEAPSTQVSMQSQSASLSSNSPSAPIHFTDAPVSKPALATPVSPSLDMDTQHAVMASTGIEISTEPTPAVRADRAVSLGVNIPTHDETLRSDMIREIENPTGGLPASFTPKPPSINLAANKLSDTGPILAPTTTDYSIPKPAAIPTPPMAELKSADPYREPIE